METKDTNPKDRVATTRLDLSLFPDTAVAYGALAMSEGDAKYGGYNYRVAGVRASVYYAAARRHMVKWFNGQWSDPKTGVPHLGSALGCIAILVDAHECGMLNDDRPPACNTTKMFLEMEARVAALHLLFPNGPDRSTELNSASLKDEKQVECRLNRRGFHPTRRRPGHGNPPLPRRIGWGRRAGDMKLHCPGAV